LAIEDGRNTERAHQRQRGSLMPIVFKGRVFSVEVETIHLRNGRPYQVETVRHRPSVVLAPMRDEDHVILVRQYRHSVGREMWELPAGSLKEGESAESAAARECEEEIALVPGRIERLAALFPAPGFCDEELTFFRVSDLREPPPDSPHRPDEDEDIQTQVFTVAEARAMVARGEIVDLKTAYGLTLI
jgi:8-oxo-dGTP pyrophosphatase MutT (NUDIX family)